MWSPPARGSSPRRARPRIPSPMPITTAAPSSCMPGGSTRRSRISAHPSRCGRCGHVLWQSRRGLRLQRDYDKAMAERRRPSGSIPSCARLSQSRRHYAARDDYKRAIEDQTAAIALDAYSVPALLNRGEAYRMLGDLPQRSTIRRGDPPSPKLPDVYLSRGLIFQAMDRRRMRSPISTWPSGSTRRCSAPMWTAAMSIASSMTTRPRWRI